MNKKGEVSRPPYVNYYVCEHCDLEFDDIEELENYNGDLYCEICGESIDIV